MYAAAAKASDLLSRTLAEMNEALVGFEQSTRARFSRLSSRLETSVTVMETEWVSAMSATRATLLGLVT